MRSRDGIFELEVLVHGRPVTEYPHLRETFVEGRRDSEYTLRARNNSGRQAAAVLSVDGLSVTSGKRATSNDSAYIIRPYSYIDVPGWRLSDRDVAHFVFSSLPEAYASQMDKPENIGVIGAVFFFEQRYRVPEFLEDFEGIYRGIGASRGGTLGAGESKSTQGVGTGFGRRTEYQVHRVDFDREPRPATEPLAIRYDDAEGLQRRGIVLSTPHNVGDRVLAADPFPGDHGVPPPSGWRG